LFKPVKKMLDARAQEVEETYQKAEQAQAQAEAAKQEYTGRIAQAKEEAQALLAQAARKAQGRSEEILSEAKRQASHLMQRTQEELEREKQRAVNEAKDEISGMAVLMAQKIVGREVDESDHERLIDEFLNEEGETPCPKQ